MTDNRNVALIAAVMLSLVLLAPARSLGQQSGAYTAQQATQGQTVYSASCAGCHGQNLEGTAAPGLTGANFLGNYSTANDLYGFIAKEMPADNPGSLKPADYLNIVAFIMQKNGFPAGSTALDASKLSGVSLKK